MSTVNSVTLDNKTPSGRATIAIDPRAYWDEAFNRPKSGYFKVNVTGVTWTHAGGDAEKVHVAVGVPNDNDFYDTLYEGDKTVSDNGYGAFNQTFKVAWNYGQPGPNARVNGDGSASLVDVEFHLNLGFDTLVTSLIGTVTYTLTFVEYDPYSVLSDSWGMTNVNHTLDVKPWRPSAIGKIPALATGSDVLVIQFRTLTTTYTDKANRSDRNEVSFLVTPMLLEDIVNSPLIYHGVSKAKSAVVTYKDFFTYVFAINDGKYDMAVAKLSLGGGYKYVPCTTALSLSPRSDDEATVVLSYDVGEDLVAL